MLRILWYRGKSRQKGETGKEAWEGGQIMGGLNTMVRSSVNCGQALAQEKVVNGLRAVLGRAGCGLWAQREGWLEARISLGRRLEDSRWTGREGPGPGRRWKERKGWIWEPPAGCVRRCDLAALVSTDFFSRGDRSLSHQLSCSLWFAKKIQ